MGKNPDEDDKSTPVVDDDENVSDEEAMRRIKKDSTDVETPSGADEAEEDDDSGEDSEEAGDDDGKTDEDTEDEDSEEDDKTDSDEEDSEFVKEFPNIKGDTVPEYARELEKTIQLSNTEGKRLADRVTELEEENRKLRDGAAPDKDTPVGQEDNKDTKPADPLTMYMGQKMQEDIDAAFSDFQKSYPKVVPGSSEYDSFTKKVAVISRAIMDTENRLAPPKELYATAAAALGWEPETTPTSKDKLGMAIKNTAAISKTTSATKKVPKSKVTDQMIAVNRMMYPGKTDDEIRKELEPHVQ